MLSRITRPHPPARIVKPMARRTARPIWISIHRTQDMAKPLMSSSAGARATHDKASSATTTGRPSHPAAPGPDGSAEPHRRSKSPCPRCPRPARGRILQRDFHRLDNLGDRFGSDSRQPGAARRQPTRNAVHQVATSLPRAVHPRHPPAGSGADLQLDAFSRALADQQVKRRRMYEDRLVQLSPPTRTDRA